MIDFTSLGIIILAAATHATLQLGLGGLLLLYNASLGRNIKTTTKKLVGSFVLGFAVLIVLTTVATCFIVTWLTAGRGLAPIVLTSSTGALMALALAMWFMYYRKGSSTELWIPKNIANFIHARARTTKNNIEVFSLGALTVLAEFPFSAVLVLVASSSILELDAKHQMIAIMLYVLIVAMPLIVLRTAVRNGKTVVEIQKWRVKNKTFLRLISGLMYVVLAIFVLAFKVVK